MRAFQTNNTWKLSTIVGFLFLCGCASFVEGLSSELYSVQINGYLDTNHQSAGQKIYVFKNPNASNHLLENEIVAKIENGLKAKGYEITKTIGEANYIINCSYAIDAGQTHSGTNTYTTSHETTKTYIDVMGDGKMKTIPVTEYQTHSTPYSYTEYTRTMRMDLYPGNEVLKVASESPSNLNIESLKPVWIGEAQSVGESSNLRKTLDPLIAINLEYFLKNTKTQVSEGIFSHDKRIKSLYREVKK